MWMIKLPRFAILVSMVAVHLTGCYRSFALEGHADSGSDLSVEPDVTTDPGIESTIDIPAEVAPDPIHEPDSDPVMEDPIDTVLDPTDWVELSDPVDWVDTADWAEVELPDVGEDAPTVVVVGDPIEITDDIYTGCIPVVEWTGSEWGVAWGGWGTPYVFRSLAATGVPSGPITVIHPYISGLYPAIRWHEGSYGFAGVQGHEDIYAGILNDSGAMIHGTAFFPGGEDWPGIDTYGQYAGWILTYVAYDSSMDGTVVYAAHMDELGRRTGAAEIVGVTDSAYSSTIVGFGDRASVIWPHSGSIWQRTFSWPNVSTSPPPTALSGSFGFISDGHIEAVAYRDRIIIAWLGSGGVRTLAYDPITGATLHGSVVAGRTGIRDRKPGLGAVHENGYLGLCWETGVGPAGGGGPSYRGDGADFRIIDEDGEPIGAPATVVSGINNIGGCAVGWSGSQFLVAYWNCGEAGDDYGIWVRRVTPLI
jgi:hypothetical protein